MKFDDYLLQRFFCKEVNRGAYLKMRSRIVLDVYGTEKLVLSLSSMYNFVVAILQSFCYHSRLLLRMHQTANSDTLISLSFFRCL
jgi:hypothetical protein